MRLFILIIALLFSQLALANSIDPDTAVSEHNKWRNLVNQGQLGSQPRPNPFIEEMYWDQSLADSSQTHADKCVWEHSNTGGENLYTQTFDDSIEIGVRLWAEEESLYDFSPISLDNVSGVGHYTQMVWHNSLRVGCAKTQCSPLKNSDGSTLFASAGFYVCQYRENGNFLGQVPYSTSGQPSSEVTYTANNTNLHFQLLKVGDQVFRAMLRLKTTSPIVFETITYELVQSVDISQFSQAADYDGSTLTIPELSIDGQNIYQAVLKHNGNLEFEVVSYQQR